MSAYGHQLERENSTQSLSRRGSSEMGSHYETEMGIYMTSFAATIFIASLLTIGLLLITMLISLVVMLQSCQSKNDGAVETWKSKDNYRYCEIYSLHAELNGLHAADYIPAICREVGIQYIKEGHYARDLNATNLMAENYFSSIQPVGDGSDIVLMDADDFFPSNSQYADRSLPSDGIEEAIHLKHMFTLKLFFKLHAAGWPLILISRNPEKQRTVTVKHLISAGYAGWSSLIMRSEDEMHMDSREYLSRRRVEMLKQGFHIIAIFSSQMDALSGLCLGNRMFKIPNSIFHNPEHYTGEKIIHNELQCETKTNHIS